MSDTLAKRAKKIRLRTGIRQTLRAKSECELQERSNALVARLQEQPFWKQSHTIALFYPMPGEADLRILWKIASQKQLCLPQIFGETLQMIPVPALPTPVPSKLILPNTQNPIPPKAIDLVLVPGLLFTKTGQRLGRGGGYYDRFLSSPHLHSFFCGITFEFQMQNDLPVESHDISLHCILTDETVYYTTSRRS